MTAAAVAPRRSPLDGAWLALGFLTIVPAPAPRGAVAPGGAWLARAAGWFPLVGALVGAVAGAVAWLAHALDVPMAAAGALGLVTAIVLTRGLHEDGLADTADGLGVHGARERRLAAMSDSAVGAHGALAMACALLLAALALAGLDAEHAFRALVLAHVLSRAAMAIAAAALAPARSDGLGASFLVGRTPAVVAGVLGVVAAFALAGDGDGLLVLAVGAAALGAALAIQERTFGGRTGDTLGATGKLVEVAVLVALAGAWS